METICMKCQIQFFGEKKEKYHQFIVCWRQEIVKVNAQIVENFCVLTQYGREHVFSENLL